MNRSALRVCICGLGVVLSLGLNAPGRARKPEPGWRLESTDLRIEIDPVRTELQGSARLALGTEGDGEKRIDLNLNPELVVRSVSDGSGQALEFDRIGAKLTIRPVGGAAAEGQPGHIVVSVQYAGSFSTRDPDVGFCQAWIGSDIAYGLPGRWYPKLAEGSSRSRGSIAYLVPKGWVVASVGRLVGEHEVSSGRRYDFDIASPVGFSFAAGPFQFARRNVDGLDAGVFLLGGAPGKPEFYLESCARIVGFFREYYGSFPHESFSVVELPQDLLGKAGGGAWESFTFFPSGVMPEGFFYSPAFAHELGHSLWSGVNSPEGPVVSEGLAQVAMGLYLEKAYGERTFRALLKNGSPELLLTHSARLYFRSLQSPPPIRGSALGLILPGEDLALGIPAPGKRNTLHMLANSKGWFVYVMLRDLIGRPAFQAGWRNALVRFRGKALTLDDLRREFEEASGRDLRWFFDQWFFRTGAPEFLLSSEVEAQGERWKVSGRIRQVRDAYRVVAEIGFVKGALRETKVIEIAAPETDYSFVLPFKPDAVLFDPDYRILRWIEEFKAPD